MGLSHYRGLVYPPRPIRTPNPELFKSKTILRIAHSSAIKAHLVPISSLSSPTELRSLCANVSGADTNLKIMYWYPNAKIWVNVCWSDPATINMEEYSFAEMMDMCEGSSMVDVFVCREGDHLPDLS